MVLYGAMLAVDAWTRPPLDEAESVRRFAPSRETLRAFGVLSPWDVFACGKVWLLVTPIFLHLGLLHLLFNGLSLFQLGPLAEQAFGPARFLSLYVLTGVVGNAVSAACGWGGAGASGSIFGLFGAVLVFARRRRHAIGPALVYRWLLQWLLYAALVTALVPGVNHLAHGAGFASGLLLGFLADRYATARVWRATARLLLPVLFAAFAATALEAPRVSRGRALVYFDGAVRSGGRAVHESSDGSAEKGKARVALRDAIRTLERPSGLGTAVEEFRGRFAEALRRFDGSRPGSSGRREAIAALEKAFGEYEAWLGAHACAFGVRRTGPD